ncbi:hypothetical protein [Pararhizobium qamdonense]|uniref:hypothetical protein n=1 Tax=Pararhizobium qamdonense TaxID=3031126 RepID=UPI0023E34902|nr:hypothetical protein [Pararhizobium qamdonense]
MIDWLFSIVAAIILWLSVNGFQPSHIIAGFFGSIARAVVAKSGTIGERLVGGFTGSLFAVYFTPLVCMLLGIPDVQIQNAIAFSIGLIGMYIAEAIIILAKEYRNNPGKLKEDMRDFLLRLITPKDK